MDTVLVSRPETISDKGSQSQKPSDLALQQTEQALAQILQRVQEDWFAALRAEHTDRRRTPRTPMRAALHEDLEKTVEQIKAQTEVMLRDREHLTRWLFGGYSVES